MKHASFLKFVGVFIALNFLVACATSPSKNESSSVVAETYRGLGKDSVDPERLKKFSPPPLDAKLAGRIRSILEVQSPGLGLTSPGGERVFFTWNVTGVPQIWASDQELRFPTQMTTGADATLIADITPDGRYLVVSRDRNGEENPGLYLLPTRGGSLIEIFQKPGVQTAFQFVNNAGDKIYFTANNLKQDSFAIYLYDIATQQTKLLFSEPGIWSVADVFADNVFLLRKATGALTAEFELWRPATGERQELLGKDENQEYEMTFASAANEFFVLTPKFTGFRRLYKFDRRKFIPVTDEVAKDIDGFFVDRARFHLYVNWNEGGYRRLEVRQISDLQPTTIPGTERFKNFFAARTSRYGRFVSIGEESDNLPRRNYFFDWKNRTLTQWMKPSVPEFDPESVPPTRLEYYPARDGTKIPMFVTRPIECLKKSCPVVVIFRGGPEGQTRPGFDRTAILLSSEGFIVAAPNVRGSDGYGKAWLAADDGAKRLEVITDVEDCALFIRKNWRVNGRSPKIGVMGGSYGGYATMYAMTRFAGAYDAGVAIVGMSNLISFLQNTAPYRRALRISEYGDPMKDREALEKLSPVNFLDRLKDPLMIIQGANDPRVPVGEALQIHDRLEARGIKVPMVIFSDEGHGSGKRENRVLELGHAIQFFNDKLRN